MGALRQQQQFAVSQLWRREALNQGVSRARFSPRALGADLVHAFILTSGVANDALFLGLWIRHSKLCLCCHITLSLLFLKGHWLYWGKGLSYSSVISSYLTNYIYNELISKLSHNLRFQEKYDLTGVGGNDTVQHNTRTNLTQWS